MRCLQIGRPRNSTSRFCDGGGIVLIVPRRPPKRSRGFGEARGTSFRTRPAEDVEVSSTFTSAESPKGAARRDRPATLWPSLPRVLTIFAGSTPQKSIIRPCSRPAGALNGRLFRAGASENKKGKDVAWCTWVGGADRRRSVRCGVSRPIQQPNVSRSSPPIPRRALAAPSMMQVLRDEHDLFEDISKEQTPSRAIAAGTIDGGSSGAGAMGAAARQLRAARA